MIFHSYHQLCIMYIAPFYLVNSRMIILLCTFLILSDLYTWYWQKWIWSPFTGLKVSLCGLQDGQLSLWLMPSLWSVLLTWVSALRRFVAVVLHPVLKARRIVKTTWCYVCYSKRSLLNVSCRWLLLHRTKIHPNLDLITLNWKNKLFSLSWIAVNLI